MKTIPLFVLLALLIASCAASQEARLATEPRSYVEAMDWLRADLELIDDHLIGSQYGVAVSDAERILKYSDALGRFEPPRISTDWEAFEEYYAQTEDLTHAADRLLFLVQQRRKVESKEQLRDVAVRYNRLSAEYGPSIEVRLTEQDENTFAGPERYRGDLPGELRYNK